MLTCVSLRSTNGKVASTKVNENNPHEKTNEMQISFLSKQLFNDRYQC